MKVDNYTKTILTVIVAIGKVSAKLYHKIPLLIIMHNNQSFYNSEEHNIRIAEFRNRPVEPAGIGTRVDNPPVDFKKVAEGFGLVWRRPDPQARRPAPGPAKGLCRGQGKEASRPGGCCIRLTVI